MDPLSMTASIIAVIQLTSNLVSYINEAKNANVDQKKMAMEASSLYGLLTTLRYRVDTSDGPWFNQVKLLAVENGALDQFKLILQKMVDQLSKSRKRDKFISALTWPFSKEDMADALARMERLKSLINCALMNDLTALSKAIQSDLGSINTDLESMKDQMAGIQTGVENLHIRVDDELPRKLSQWLQIPDPSTHYHAAVKKRSPETGNWLLNGLDFANWRVASSSLMWLHGNAGCGKTILSTAALSCLLKYQDSHPEVTVSYFYFDFNDAEKQSSNKAIRSLLFQLGLQAEETLNDLEQLYQRCRNGEQQPAEDAVHSILLEAVARPGEKYIVLDALDECTDRESLLASIRELIDLSPPDLHILATSRREKDIEDELSSLANPNISIQSALVDEDIRLYVREQLATDKKLKKWPDSVKTEIATELMEKASGMFRWVYCQLDSIRHCVKLSALRKALSSLPTSLDETYNRILRDLESKGQLQDAIHTLQWLCFSDRPLTLSEVVEILAIDDDTGFDPEERLPDPMDVAAVCSSLISYLPFASDDDLFEDSDGDSKSDADEYNGVNPARIRVQLAHFSVKEFLLSNRCDFNSAFRPQICHTFIAKDSLQYLHHLRLHSMSNRVETPGTEYPLSTYAAREWWKHLQAIEGELDNTLLTLGVRILTNKDALISWSWLSYIDSHYDGDPTRFMMAEDLAPPLYYASLIGVSTLYENVKEPNTDINAKGGFCGNALQAASYKGHEDIVRMLIDANADVNAQGGAFGTALQAASANGNERIVQMLIVAKADVNAQGGYYGTTLQAASVGGHEEIIRMLIDAKADVNTQEGAFGTALQAASANGHEKVVQMLIDANADVNAQGGYYGTALQAASVTGYEKVVQMLIDAKANLNVRGGAHERNFFEGMTRNGYKEIMRMLSKAKAGVSVRDSEKGNVLSTASCSSRERIVQILTDAKVDVDVMVNLVRQADSNSLTEFHANSETDADTLNGDIGDALYLAIGRQEEKIVQLLLDAGAVLPTLAE